MKVSIKDGILTIEMPVNDPMTLSSTGKTFIVAGTGGFIKTDQLHDGKAVSVSVNVTVPAQVKKAA